jgi:hypothetical protein
MRVAPLLFASLLQGCIGSALVDALSPADRGEREGMVVVARDEAFVLHAFPGSSAAERAASDLPHLERSLAFLSERVGTTIPRPVDVYLHPEGVFSSVLTFGGFAWLDELSIDLRWTADDLVRWRIETHELAHLALGHRYGSIDRPFLSEGLARYLEDSFAYPGAGASGSVARFNGECDPSFSIRAIFPGAAWFQRNHDGEGGSTYRAAASFTELLVARLGLEAYVERFALPASPGTSAEAESLLAALVGLDFAATEQLMREANLRVSPRPCQRGYEQVCPGVCGCALAAGANQGVCLPPGVQP